MAHAIDASYQPAVAYQGGNANTAEQEPKSGQTQPQKAASSDTQRGGQRTSREDTAYEARGPDKSEGSEPTQDSKSSFTNSRGENLDLNA